MKHFTEPNFINNYRNESQIWLPSKMLDENFLVLNLQAETKESYYLKEITLLTHRVQWFDLHTQDAVF